VAQDATVGHRGDVAFEDVQVGAANRHRVDAHDRVGVVDDDWHGDFLPGLLAGTVVDDSAHRMCSFVDGALLSTVGNKRFQPVEANVPKRAHR